MSVKGKLARGKRGLKHRGLFPVFHHLEAARLFFSPEVEFSSLPRKTKGGWLGDRSAGKGLGGRRKDPSSISSTHMIKSLA